MCGVFIFCLFYIISVSFRLCFSQIVGCIVVPPARANRESVPYDLQPFFSSRPKAMELKISIFCSVYTVAYAFRGRLPVIPLPSFLFIWLVCASVSVHCARILKHYLYIFPSTRLVGLIFFLSVWPEWCFLTISPAFPFRLFIKVPMWLFLLVFVLQQIVLAP